VALKPSQGRYKVAVIAMAERMSHEAANALLKTLEEPPAKTVIILTASMPDVLQKTIVSRCQRVPFGLVKRATIEAVLTKRFGLSEEQADLWATVSGGRLGVAIEEAENNQFKLRETSLTCLMKLLRGEASPVAMAETVVDLASHMQEEMKRQAHQEVKRMKEEHQEAETSAAEDKIEAGFQARYRAWVEDLIDTFSVWFRDALVLAHRGDDGLLINKDHAQEIAEIGRTLPRARLFKAADTAILARERLAANVQLKFLMERLFLEMMGSMDHA
jgi:DNA polymerase-3 subunit delta'